MNIISASEPKIIQVVGYKNTGKTTMTATLIAGLVAHGLKVAAIKHDGHDHFEMDQKGTDSYQFGKAGAAAVVVMSQKRTAMIEQHSTRLEDMLNQLSDYDWIVIEGFKEAPYPKLVMVREAQDLSLAGQLQHVVGIVFWSLELMEKAGLETDVELETDIDTELDTVETEAGAKVETRKTEIRCDERNVRKNEEKLRFRNDKEQDIRERAMATFLFSEREAIVEAVLQLNSTEKNQER